jgi:hypothetical protein
MGKSGKGSAPAKILGVKAKGKGKAKAKAKGSASSSGASHGHGQASALATGKAIAKAKAKAKPVAKPVAMEGIGNGAKASTGDAKGWDLVQAGQSMGKGAQTVMDHLKSLAKKGNTTPLTTYQGLKSNQEKLEFSLSLKLDREASFLQVKEYHNMEARHQQEVVKGWTHMGVIAHEECLMGYETNQDQKLMLTTILDTLPSRPHSNPTLAAKGFKEYYYVGKKLDKEQQMNVSGMEASAKATVTDHKDFDSYMKDLCNYGDGSTSVTRKGKKQLPPKPADDQEPPEVKAKIAWIKEVTTMQRNLDMDSKVIMKLKIKGKCMDKSMLTPGLMDQLNATHLSILEAHQDITEVLVNASSIDAGDFNGDEFEAKVEECKNVWEKAMEVKSLGIKLIGK